jgi:hypothetical protein
MLLCYNVYRKGGKGMKLEEKILKSFKKYMGKEVEGLDLIVTLSEDNWPDFEGTYACEVMERQDNGRVWSCECTRNGNVKDTYEL